MPFFDSYYSFISKFGLSDCLLYKRFEKLIKEIFTLVAVKSYFDTGLPNPYNLTVANYIACARCNSSYFVKMEFTTVSSP